MMNKMKMEDKERKEIAKEKEEQRKASNPDQNANDEGKLIITISLLDCT
jgi:hypothetical protein